LISVDELNDEKQWGSLQSGVAGVAKLADIDPYHLVAGGILWSVLLKLVKAER